jgi:hypothetical protein
VVISNTVTLVSVSTMQATDSAALLVPLAPHIVSTTLNWALPLIMRA